MKNSTFTRTATFLIVGSFAALSSSIAFAQDAPVGTPAAIISASAGPAAVGSTLESHIGTDGTVLIRGARISAINPSSVTVTQTWGSYVSTWTVNVTASTELLRRYGGASGLLEFSVGDYLAVKGALDTTTSQPTITASVIRDYSIQKVNASFSGTVSSVSAANMSFVLATPSRGNVTVFVASSTLVKQGSATTTFATLAAGQKITRASGLWSNLNNTLIADHVDIYQNTRLLNKRIFEGTITLLPSTSAPTTFSFVSASTTYTVNVAENTTLLSSSYNPIAVTQWTTNDKLRIYGAVEANNLSTIDAYVVRDVSVK